MASTPSSIRRTSSRRKKAANTSAATTPGETSVASARSAVSTGSGASRGGVPWHIQKAFAHKIEAAFPLAACWRGGINSIHALYRSTPQALIKFLKKLSQEDPDNGEIFEARKDQISNLCQYWKRKSLEQFDSLWLSFGLPTGTSATPIFPSSPPAGVAPKKAAPKKPAVARKTAPPPASPDSVESDLSDDEDIPSSSSSCSSETPPQRQEAKKHQQQSALPPKKIDLPTRHQPGKKKAREPEPSATMNDEVKALAKEWGKWHTYSQYSAAAFCF
jgi:hypothetical protein